MFGRVLIATAAAIGLGASTAAADEHAVSIGDRVRVSAPSVSPKRIEGTLVVVDSETLTIASGGASVGVPRSGIAKLEVTRGRKSHWVTGALIGAGWGVGVGVLFSNPPSSADHFSIDTGALAAGVVMGATLGALIGAVLRTDRWTTVPGAATLRIGPVPGRGVALSMRVSF